MVRTVVTRLLLLVVLAVPACAEKEMSYTLPLSGERVVPVQVESAGYSPALVETVLGERLLLRVTNRGSQTHYLTVKNPRGDFIRSVVLPVSQTVEVPLLLTEEGIWRFYGERPVEREFDMQGRIIVAPRPSEGNS